MKGMRRAMDVQGCESCALREHLVRMGVRVDSFDYVLALMGNPNTGKSTVFNALTGLRQHTGNWTGKTVTRMEGAFEFNGKRYKIVDLPGTYSLLSASVDEEVARDFVLFAKPDAVIVVVDATILERNLNLVLQVLEITDRVVVCLNLIDEAERKGIEVDHRALSRELGVPVVPTAARQGVGLGLLMQTVAELVTGTITTSPRRVKTDEKVERALDELTPVIHEVYPDLPNVRWIAMRLLDGDYNVRQSLESGELLRLARPEAGDADIEHARQHAPSILAQTEALQRRLEGSFRDRVVESLYAEAETIARKVVHRKDERRWDWDQKLDRILTSRVWGLPVMGLLLLGVFWVTIQGANVISEFIAAGLFWIEAKGSALFTTLGVPWWLTGFVWHGVYRGLAWVVSVMLPPMAIFFPIFTILEDMGYLPRVAFNMDKFFQKAGAHGKQALTMAMGLGCNAAGVVATRIINSPRERLIAILTNNFMPCNGRWPLLITMSMLFVAASFPPAFAAAVAAGTLVVVLLVGVWMTFLVSVVLSRTILKGEASSFTLELPPYRKPNILAVLYTSVIDRTLTVLWRAVVMAAPAGGLIWLLGNIHAEGQNLSHWIARWLDPVGRAIGLDGVVLLAYIIAIPANEIVVPTIIMTYMGTGMMTELENLSELRHLLVDQHGWTTWTAICLMLFSLLHNPCSTTILTIWRETKSAKWASIGALLPLGIAFAVLLVLNGIVRWIH
ncbi:MAG: ferrous iron transport protein B [Armatimonadota bacterium]|nr:MAG: ferrous iron transport protein B [Armatimonadota bacterium]